MAFDPNRIENKKVFQPPLLVLYGEPGVGKTTFAVSAPNPFVIDFENGSKNFDVARVHPESLDDMHEVLDFLLNEKHDYQSIVLDSADWLESSIHKKICKESGANTISDKRNDVTAFGNGHIRAANEFKYVLMRLEEIRNKRNMAIIITGHSHVKRIDEPDGGAYDKYVIKLHDKAGSVLTEWATAILFAKKETKLDQNGKAHEGRRVLVADGTKAATAKNRLELPATMDMSWNGFIKSIGTNPFIQQ